MDEFEEINYDTLTPNKYPLWVLSFSVIVLLLSIYSLCLLPKYIDASIKLNSGQQAYKERNYLEAIRLYQEVLKAVPSSKEAKISIAEAFFSIPSTETHKLGLVYLQGVELDRWERLRLSQVAPGEYKKYFSFIKK